MYKSPSPDTLQLDKQYTSKVSIHSSSYTVYDFGDTKSLLLLGNESCHFLKTPNLKNRQQIDRQTHNNDICF